MRGMGATEISDSIPGFEGRVCWNWRNSHYIIVVHLDEIMVEDG